MGMLQFIEEPKNKAFEALIDYIFEVAEVFALTAYPQDRKHKYTAEDLKIYEELAPYIVNVRMQKSAKRHDFALYDEKIIYVKADKETKEILMKYNKGELHSWEHPLVFNKITFFKDEGYDWFYLVNNEKYSAFDEEDKEIIDKVMNVTGISLKAEEEQPGPVEIFINDESNCVIKEGSSHDLSEADLENMHKFAEYIKKNKISWYMAKDDYLYVESNGFFAPMLETDIKKKVIEGRSFEAVRCLYVSEDLLAELNMYNGKLKGKDESAVPVVMGLDFRTDFRIDEIVHFIYEDKHGKREIKTLEVCGFLDMDNHTAVNGRGDSFENLKGYLLMPSHYADDISPYDFRKYGYFNFKDEEERVKAEEYAEELGLDYKFIRIKNQK